ncbi:MAG: type 2 isopentenyl-diphosphate Delta-isomerase [Candidatus Bathyarchaeota archaeon]|nr:type 2 isopentenyl-diphosphate Delta-isomerase [Candidatus Bathyarchaeota archaeon]MCX8161507.1 type 2 isopentenyl-diphosphate Delta-isomerase [Candidatus Bathyarchaeota archaeon]
MDIEVRKDEHIEICLAEAVEAERETTWLEYVYLPHRCLPEVDPEDVGLEVDFLGFRFSAPIMVSAITGGSSLGFKINANIAEAVEKLRLGMCVGSQRIALEKPETVYSFKIARERAPTAFISANIGFQELRRYSVDRLIELVESIEADALTIHLNPLQELLQIESKPTFKGLTSKIGEAVKQLRIPVIVKETGAGMIREDAVKLEELGVKAIDVAGLGGTSWSRVEYHRAVRWHNYLKAGVSKAFWDWGIPTAASIIEVRSAVRSARIIASGGLRSGVDIAKAICLGADMCAVALPILKPALRGPHEIEKILRILIEGLRTAAVLTGVSRIDELKKVKPIIAGRLAEWVNERGLKG